MKDEGKKKKERMKHKKLEEGTSAGNSDDFLLEWLSANGWLNG